MNHLASDDLCVHDYQPFSHFDDLKLLEWCSHHTFQIFSSKCVSGTGVYLCIVHLSEHNIGISGQSSLITISDLLITMAKSKLPDSLHCVREAGHS